MKVLRLILGDQLNIQHPWFEKTDPDVTYCMFEMRQETDYVVHHIQKVVGFFAAMRSFAEKLQNEQHQVVYLTLDHPDNLHNLDQNILKLVRDQAFDRFEYQLPDEYRLDAQLKKLCQSLSIPTEAIDTAHFLTTRDELATFFKGKKQYLMESFYRYMRKKHNILMKGDQPEGNHWNFDKENRKKIPKNHVPPHPKTFPKNVEHLVQMLENAQIRTIGQIDPHHFLWPTTREEALQLLEYFLNNLLIHFGDYQDAMTPDYWALYHSRISFALNIKLLCTNEVISRTEKKWRENIDKVKLSSAEGFLRQVIGWREYMRGIYWAKMPAYATLNYLNHQASLPAWFWTGETRMKCLQHSIGQSLDYAYAHHIQRLMVTGNFALLAGIHPDQVDQWYLGIYIDAIEWVEITNTRGMSQFADGGIVGTKPYVASANYMQKMGHYCENCSYKANLKTGKNACPFNSLYWDFMDRHRSKLENNPRIGMAYRTWDRMPPETKEAYLQQASFYKKNLENL